MHSLLRAIAAADPTFFSIHLDGTEIYRGKFTDGSIVTILDKPVDLNQPRHSLTFFFDNIPIPVHSLELGGEVG